MGQVGAPVHLVQSEKDVENLKLSNDTPVAYVTQTTLSIDDTRSIIGALNRRFTDIVGPEHHPTSATATQNRQTAVRELCRVADVIHLVGAKNSSNFQPPAGNRYRGRRAFLSDCGRQRTRIRLGER